ncbi:MAG: helix-turn-helix domain-containing protein [Treponema sp.]|jgi:transcriptional regulator with XRE-family HTH domain|nr:helix-turn-helix domain-containing protein [Treponema sp.]
MKRINDRLKEVRTTLEISQREFSKRIYISQSFYSELELGNQVINERIIHLVSTIFNVNKEWLRTGKGEVFSSQPPDVRLDRLIEIYNNLDEQLQEYLLLQSDVLLKIQKEMIDKRGCSKTSVLEQPQEIEDSLEQNEK